MKKQKILWLSLILALIMSVSVITAFAAGEPTLTVKTTSLELENAVYMNFKVQSQNISDTSSVKLLVWESYPGEYIKGTEDAELSVMKTEAGTGYLVFQYTDLAAKDMTKFVYVCAYANVNGEPIYSKPTKFSIVQYAYNTQTNASASESLKTLVNNMLAYGASAQTYFNHNTDFLATDPIVKIRVEGGTHADGFKTMYYQKGEMALLTANDPEVGKKFSHWENSKGISVGTSSTLSIPVNADDTYTAIYKDDLGYTEGLIFRHRQYLPTNVNDYVIDGLEETCTDTEIVIPAMYNGLPVTTIGPNAFQNHTTMTSISIPETVTTIYSAFSGCTSLTSITLPENLQYLEYDAFKDCTSLAVIHVSENITNLGSNAFKNTAYYNDPENWENGILYLENYLLAADETVTICEVKEGTTLIGGNAFRNAVNMTEISLPKSLLELTFAPLFGGCGSLANIMVHEDNLFFTSIDGNLYNKTGTTLIQYAIGKTATTFTIPNNVTTIGWAFGDATFLEEVNIPESVTTIDGGAFQNCSNLKSIAIPSGVSVIELFTFRGCSNLEEVVLPENLVTIGQNAFARCASLTTIDIPDSVTFIGPCAFQGCSGLTGIDIPNGVTSIENTTFDGCSNLTSINIPNGVESIGDYAFYDCTALQTIDLSENLVTIGKSAFYNCNSITAIDIPDSVESIGDYTFYNCTTLQTIDLSENLVSIGESAFYNCRGLIEIDIPDSVKNMGQYAFRNCTSLETVDLPSGTEKISYCLFRQCTNLESVTIPEGVTTIDTGAFYGCSLLQSVVLPKSLATCSGSVFSRTALSEVYYLGTADEWSAVTIASTSGLQNGTVYYYSKNKPIAGEYAWHYNEDGKIEFWPLEYSTGLAYWDVFSGRESFPYNGVGYNANCTDRNIVIPCMLESSLYNGVQMLVKGIVTCGFAGNTTVSTITLPSTMKYISDNAFDGCTALEYIRIPKNLVSIDENAFYDCANLSNVYYMGSEEDWNSISIGIGNDDFVNATRYYYSETRPTTTGNYWHYNDAGEIEIWQ